MGAHDSVSIQKVTFHKHIFLCACAFQAPGACLKAEENLEVMVTAASSRTACMQALCKSYAQALAECGMPCLTGDRETADMLANKLKSDEARQRDAAAAEPPVP